MVKSKYRKKIKKTLAAVMTASMLMSSLSLNVLANVETDAPSNAEVSVTVNGPNTTVTADGVKITVTETVTESQETNTDGALINSEKTEVETRKEDSDNNTVTNTVETQWKETVTEPTVETTGKKVDSVTVTEGKEISEDTVVTDEKNRVIKESGSESGSETTTKTETTVENYTEDRDDLENDHTIEGTPKVTKDHEGSYSAPTITQKETTKSTEIDPGYAGDITVDLTPGTEATGSAAVDENRIYEQQIAKDRPETGTVYGTPVVEDIVDDETGEKIGTLTTTTDVQTIVSDVKNQNEEVVGYETKEITTTKVERKISDTVDDEKGPVTVESPTTTYDPITTTEVVLPEKPEAGETVDASGNKVVTNVVEIKGVVDGVETVIGYQTTTEVFDEDGNKVSWGSESLWGKKTTTVTKKETISTTTTATDYITTETTTTDFTEGTTTNGVWITSTPRQVTASMSDVSKGDGDGNNALTALNVDTETLLANLAINELFTDKQEPHKVIGDDVFHYVGHLVGSNYLVYRKGENDDSHTDVYIYVLKDKEGNEFYGYCADVATHAEKGTLYKIANIEDATYYQNNADGQAEAHIRAIALNGFWGTASGTGSLAAVKKLLKDAGYTAWDTLTEGQALAATQAAMWKYGNNGKAYPVDESNVSSRSFALGGKSDGTQGDANIQKLYEILISKTAPADTSTNILDPKDILEASITVGQKVADDDRNKDTDENNDVFNSAVSFTVALVPDANDNLVAVITQNGEKVGELNLTAQNGTTDQSGNTKYTIEGIKLQEGIEINLSLEGTQNLEKGVYIYTAELGVNHSQTFVGVAEGTHTVDLDVNMTFNVTDETAAKNNRSMKTERTKRDLYETETINTAIDEEVIASIEVTSVTVTETSSEWNNGYLRTYTYKDETKNEEPGRNDKKEEKKVSHNDPADGEYVILDEELPLGNLVLTSLPKTGDTSGLWMLVSLLSGLSLAGFSLTGKRRKEE